MEKHLLFICSGNIDRSPAAEALFKNHPVYHAKSAGVGPLTENPVTREMINWADKIFVMEHEHKVILSKRFPDVECVEVLGISNDFCRYDVELEKELRYKLRELIKD
jgi:predicted protein tyrosine phosphatase